MCMAPRAETRPPSPIAPFFASANLPAPTSKHAAKVNGVIGGERVNTKDWSIFIGYH